MLKTLKHTSLPKQHHQTRDAVVHGQHSVPSSPLPSHVFILFVLLGCRSPRLAGKNALSGSHHLGGGQAAQRLVGFEGGDVSRAILERNDGKHASTASHVQHARGPAVRGLELGQSRGNAFLVRLGRTKEVRTTRTVAKCCQDLVAIHVIEHGQHVGRHILKHDTVSGCSSGFRLLRLRKSKMMDTAFCFLLPCSVHSCFAGGIP